MWLACDRSGGEIVRRDGGAQGRQPEVADGEFCVIVGASGCGKSTLLRAIAGLDQLDSGSISIGDRRVDRLPPADRGIAMVFQSYALYPHLIVYENMAFALRLAKRPKDEVDAAVRRASDILGLDDYLERKPAALSGGQRQRVAIGRAIVRQPDVFLFDEPLSNLDASLRNRMRFEFAALHKTLGTTTVYVTHDQVEAMTLADRIVVMREGRVEQVGTPTELYDRPANRFVAGFLGSPQMNFLSGEVVDDGSAGRALELAERRARRACRPTTRPGRRAADDRRPARTLAPRQRPRARACAPISSSGSGAASTSTSTSRRPTARRWCGTMSSPRGSAKARPCG